MYTLHTCTQAAKRMHNFNICLETRVFPTHTFFIYTCSETKTFFDNLRILSTQSVACLFGHLGRHETREQRKLEKESFAP